jgi:TolB protein
MRVRCAMCLSLILLAAPAWAQPEPGPLAIALDGSLQNPCWAPDGDALVVTRFRDGYNSGLTDLYLVPLDGGAPQRLTELEAMNVNMPGACWDRNLGIVFISDVEDRDEIWITDEGNDTRRITSRPGAVAFEATFSPDGSAIVFESHPEGVDGEGSLWIVDPDGGNLAQLTDGSGDDRQPNWSPAGDRIVFQSQRAGSWDIWTIAPDGSGLTQVTTGEAEDTDPSFSPDGRLIVFSSDAGGDTGDLHIVPAEGGTPIRIREGTGYAGAASWSPDGRWIAFETLAADDPDGSAGTGIAIIAAP